MSSSPNEEMNPSPNNKAYESATMATMAALQKAVSPAELTFVSNRPLAEIEALQQEVASVVPAGNIVGLVTNGLMRLRDRSLPSGQAKSDVSALLRGIEMLPQNILSGTLYGTLFAGPAAVLGAYQKILTLTGKNLDTAFPDGLWQFYLEFAMREDSARHANETIGFQQAIHEYGLQLSEADQLAAWVCAVSQAYFNYDELLHNEWREQTYINLLEDAAEEANQSHQLHFRRLWRAWATQRPYQRGQDAGPNEDYIQYRRSRFDNFVRSRLKHLSQEHRHKLRSAFQSRRDEELADYQNQMTLLAMLEPEKYRENRRALPLWQAHIGIIHRGAYYLLPICQTDLAGHPLMFESKGADSKNVPLQINENGEIVNGKGEVLVADRSGQVHSSQTNEFKGYLRPIHFQSVRRQVAAILEQSEQATTRNNSSLDQQLIAIERAEQERARKMIKDKATQQSLQALRSAPVLINWDEQPHSSPLASIRRGQRGVGDHALTIFRTNKSMVFDQSHIFFDGIWGIAFSEILTRETISWAAYFNSLKPPEPMKKVSHHLNLPHDKALERIPKSVTTEVSAESSNVRTRLLYTLLQLFPKRNRDLRLTVNDLLILYRCEFGHEYQPSTIIQSALQGLKAENTTEARQAHQLINQILEQFQARNPSLLIPMNAIEAPPRERLYPTTFHSPFPDLWPTYEKTHRQLRQYEVSQTQAHWMVFTENRNSLLVQLSYFGELLRNYKKVALAGGSLSTATMKLFAHVHPALMELMQEIPQRVDILNEMVKGEEVFSNVGRVARGTSLSRFISAKDDHENKALVWGVLTDDKDILRLSLRDFRPYVGALDKMGRIDLADLIVKDYLDSFTIGFNQFIASLSDILKATATHAGGENA